MSVRAIKKKENQSRRSFKHQQILNIDQPSIPAINQINLRTRSNSYPSLRTSHHDIRLGNCVHSKSEPNLSILNELPSVTTQTHANLINAKSETCLKTLSVHNTMDAAAIRTSENAPNSSHQFRRMSERSNVSSSHSPTSESQNRGFADPNNIRIPIIGYEVMEERARFTVSGLPNDQLNFFSFYLK